MCVEDIRRVGRVSVHWSDECEYGSGRFRDERIGSGVGWKHVYVRGLLEFRFLEVEVWGGW